MNKKNNSLSVALQPVSAVSDFQGMLSGAPAAVLLIGGLSPVLAQNFPSFMFPWWQTALAALALFSIFTLLQKTGKGRLCLLVAALTALLFCAVFHARFLAGLGCLSNDILERMTALTGRIYLAHTAAEASAVPFAAVPLLVLALVLLCFSLSSGHVLFFLPVLLPFYAAVLFGLFPFDVSALLFLLGSVLLLMRSATAKIMMQGFFGLPVWLGAALLALLLSVGAGLLLHGSANENAAKEIKTALHRILYDDKTNSMPEGKLKNLPAWNKTQTPALSVSMSEPQKMYLRGRIYETYTGSAWEPLPFDARAEYEELFYWLHESGIYGQSQIGTASALAEEVQAASLSIKNLSACSASGYYPYALLGSEPLPADLIGDDALPAAASLSYLPGSLPEWYGAQQALAAVQKKSDVKAYLAAEESLAKYVSAVDVQLTNESWTVLDRRLGDDSTPKTLGEIRSVILDYLDEALVYDETVYTYNGGMDFLQYTLEKSGSGYSVHYATAAVLMLRYFGVPARYVEGYFLSKEEAASIEAGAEYILSEAHAHAWAEYYLPGIGFVPFEVTPGYIDEEELELGGSIAPNTQTYSGNHLKYARVEQPEHIEEPLQERFAFSFKPIYLLYLLLLVLLALAAIILKKRQKLKKALAAIESAENRDSIAMRYGYTVRLAQSCGASAQGAEEAALLNREALFSNHPMADAQRHEMDAYACRMLTACRETWSWREKLRYRLWDCLY